ncbi:MAG: hypothetical protein ACRC80_25960 [Waterburya sp.]
MTQKAHVSQIQFGNKFIEGLLLPNGNFGIAVPQAASAFAVPQKNSTREFKAILGAGFQFLKISTELNPKKVNVLLLADFEKLTFELALKGNDKAIDFVRDLYGMSLHQLFCDAFGVKFESLDRQIWLKERQDGKKARRDYTDLIQRSGNTNYGWLTLSLYQAIGMEETYLVWRESEEAQLKAKQKNTGFRDTLNDELLRLIKEAEFFVVTSVEEYDTTLEQAFEKAKQRYERKRAKTS